MTTVPETKTSPADEAFSFVKLFSDLTRLKLGGLLAAHSSTAEQLAAGLELPMQDIVRQLSYLEHAGMVTKQMDGRFVFEAKALEATARRVLANSRPKVDVDSLTGDEFDRKVLSDFLDEHGRLKSLPSQSRKLQAILRHVKSVFEPGARYPEKEVNLLLSRFHEDTAGLRRSLVDNGHMARQDRIYWLTDVVADKSDKKASQG